MANKMNPVVHFEMPAEDRDRMKDFYASAFGWEYNQLGPEMGNYTVVMTTESDNNGPLKKGIINGGFFLRRRQSRVGAPTASVGAENEEHTRLVIAVDDIRAAMKKVEQAGGKVLGAQKPGEPDDIPGVGLYISIIDTEGNRVGMLEPVPMTGGAK